MRSCIWILGMAAAMACAGGSAFAECEGGTRQLITAYQTLPNGDLKNRLAHDIDRAVRDIDEGDETECATVLDHAQRLLKTMP